LGQGRGDRSGDLGQRIPASAGRTAMILLLRLIVKIVKWAVIVVAYMIMGLV
jgi:hypothetical protein